LRIHLPSAACGLIAIALAGCGSGSTASGTSSTRTSTSPASPAVTLSVLVTGLANPRQLSVAADGAIYVAEAGDGGHSGCTKVAGATTTICVGETGSIARVQRGTAVPVITGLPSVSSAGGQESSGPADVVVTGSKLAFVVQDTDISSTGANQFAVLGKPLGRLAIATTHGTGLRLSADLGRYEATHNPDHGAGAAAANRIESDPYGLVAYRDGYAVADAAANDLLWVDATGAIHLLAVFPTQTETSAGGARSVAQSVPTSVAVGPDGALYVSELTGAPFQVGAARVWRVVPGRAPTVYESGFTDISAIAFDRTGRLLVLEINQLGLTHPHGSGELIRVGADQTRTVLLARELVSPTGLAVGSDGSIYISNYGSSPSTGPSPHGEILRLTPG
jgi:glucose/arabinose dehydrogenase